MAPPTADTSAQSDFRSLWLAGTATELGGRVTGFAAPVLALDLTGSPVLAGLTGAVYLLGTVAALLPAGALADRSDRARILCAGPLAALVAAASLAVAIALDALTLAHLLGAALVAGVVAGTTAPAELSAIRTVVARDDLPAALSRIQARQHVAALVGGPLGATLLGAARWLPFTVDALCSAAAWLLLRRLRTDLRPAPALAAARPGPTAGVREGIAYVLQHPLLRTLAVWAALSNLVINALFTLAFLRMLDGGVSLRTVGLVESVAGVAGIVGAALAPWAIARVPTGRLTIAVAWSPLPLCVPMAIWDHPAWVAAGLAGVLLLNPAGNAGMSSYRLSWIPADLVGRVQGASQLLSMSALPLAPVLAGTLLATLGGRAGTLAAGILCALVALVPTVSRHVRSVPRPDAWPTAPAVRPEPTAA